MQPRAFLGLLGVAAVLGTACGEPNPTGPGAADRTLVAELLPHHHLGMVLTEEGAQRAAEVRLRRLIFEMGSYHAVEIDTLEQWADAWGVSSAASFPGELSAPELERLPTLQGLDHDIWWLHLMIEHHEGALAITAATAADSLLPDVASLAATVRRVQTAELDTMRALLVELCAESPADGCPPPGS